VEKGTAPLPTTFPYMHRSYARNGRPGSGERHGAEQLGPHNAVILAEFDGTVQFDAIGRSVGCSASNLIRPSPREVAIIESKAKDQNPSIIIRPGKRATQKVVWVTASPWFALCVENNDKSKLSHSWLRFLACGQDPRHHRWSAACDGAFEARNPSNPAVVSETTA
jgi:DNA-directed RNA polymerase subunit beta'